MDSAIDRHTGQIIDGENSGISIRLIKMDISAVVAG
jgi:hypothetical protein